jgi:hypothetical protein
MQSENETQRLTTIRFSLPSDVSGLVKNMKPIGDDLLVYVRDTDVKSVTEKFTGMGLTPVQREYKLHISSPSEEVFTKVFGSLEKEVRESPNKYVVTVTVGSKEEYDKLLELSGTSDCRVKPFRNLRAKWTASRSSDDDHDVQRHGGQGQSQRYGSRSSSSSGGSWQRASGPRQSGSSSWQQRGQRNGSSSGNRNNV